MKRLTVTSLIGATAMFFIGCGGGTSTTSPTTPIIIGAAYAKTGGFAPFDAAIMAGVQMAITDINGKGGVLGRQMKFVSSDTKSDPNLGATAASQVLDQGASLLVTMSDYDQAVGAALVGQSKGVLVFSPAAGSPKFGVQGIGNLAFTMGEAASAEGVILADWARQKQGWKSAYVLLDTTLAFTKSNCDGFQARWQQDGGTIVGHDTFANGDPSIQVQVTRLLAVSSHPDFIMLCSYPPGGVSAIKQLRAAGADEPIVGNSSFDGSYWHASVPNLSNFYYDPYGSYFGNDPRAEVNSLVPRLQAISAAGDNSLALCGYAVIETFAAAAKQANSLDGQKLRQVIETTHLDTVLGPTLYGPQQHIMNADRAMVIMSVQSGSTKFVTLFNSTNPPALNYTS